MKNIFTKENIKKSLLWFFNSFIWLFVILFILDILSKQLLLNAVGGWDTIYVDGVIQYSSFSSFKITIIPNFISFGFTLNDGAAWGMFGNISNNVLRRTLLIGVSLIMVIAFVTYYIVKYKTLNKFYKAFLMCATAGAFGNFIDRAFYPNGLVVDFLKFDFMNFPLFNVADSVLVVSFAGLIIYTIVMEIIEHVNKNKAQNNTINSEIKEENLSLNVKEDQKTIIDIKENSVKKNEDNNEENNNK